MTFFSETAFAQAAVAAAPSASMAEQMLPIGVMVIAFYFFLIRPQQKRSKQHNEFIKNLKRGDNVLTASGIYAEVYNVTDKFATVEIADNVRVRILKSQIAGFSKQEETPK